MAGRAMSHPMTAPRTMLTAMLNSSMLIPSTGFVARYLFVKSTLKKLL
jgi:hypothetical protein